MAVLALPVLLDPLGLLPHFMVAWLASVGLAGLSIVATLLFVLAGAQPRRPYYFVGIACFGVSHCVLLMSRFEWWLGAMLEMPFTWHPFTSALPVLWVLSLILIATAPALRRKRDARLSESGSRA
jgi:hypothetical protein